MVKQALYEGLYRPLDNSDPDLSLINAINAWTAVGGPGNAGAGMKVGIIDTGIDQTHDCFNPAGYAYPAGFPKGDHSFTTPKVIVAKVFNNQSNRFGYTARAVQEHGTHVAGTVACNLDTHATVAGVSIPYGVSGVAPRAYLGNYNVFPRTDDNARSEDILNALDAAYEDGMDVINMSLGGLRSACPPPVRKSRTPWSTRSSSSNSYGRRRRAASERPFVFYVLCLNREFSGEG